jgi:hypothetical protein
VIFRGGLEAPHFEIITTNAVAEENLGCSKASLDRGMLELRGEAQKFLGCRVTCARSVSAAAFNLKLCRW